MSQDTQPRTYTPSWSALLSFPFRLCNPPPAVVTPLLQVRLEDVLDRKHLPPLGLKDFEEWLLYVENCPENLYFILWLREYTVKYHQWAAASKARRQTVQYLQEQAPAPSASHLSMFYARAKQTFFMPNSIYELNLPSDILAPFHTTDLCQHPDPSLFNQVSQEVTTMLEKSLVRFLSAQLTNVGNNRVLCGIVAGGIFTLVGFIPPLVLNFVEGRSRWNRLTAFPGMWIGLSIMLAAFNGICLGVYVFGDLRQLRKFELERPPISKPRPLGKVSLPLFSPPSSRITTTIPTSPETLVAPSPPPPAHTVENNNLTRTPTNSSAFSLSSESSESSESRLRIEISGAYYETESIDDDPYYSPNAQDTNFIFHEKTEDDHSVFAPTAAFIHPYDSTIDLEEDNSKFLPQERQPMSAFNFDALPPRPSTGRSRVTITRLPKPMRPVHHAQQIQPVHEIVEIKSDLQPLSLSTVSPAKILEQLQHRCMPKKWLVINRKTESTEPSPLPASGNAESETAEKAEATGTHPLKHRASHFSIRKQFKKVKAVPAFASPLTRVLSPAVIKQPPVTRLFKKISAFNASTRYWRPLCPPTNSYRQSFTLTSWNIDALSNRPVARSRAIFDYILQGPKLPDILFLQEVTLEARNSILSDKRVRDGFLLTEGEDDTSFEGVPFSTMTLLSRTRFTAEHESLLTTDEEPNLLIGPVFRQMLPSKFKRDALCVDVVLPTSPGTLLRLINVHLDSLEDTKRYRTEQMKILADVLREPGCGRGLIAGDFNAIGLEDKWLVETNNMVDAWVQLNGTTGPDGHTWSVGVERNDGLQPRRLDKVAMVGLEPTEMQVLRPGSILMPTPYGKYQVYELTTDKTLLQVAPFDAISL
ncbi:hypothetical protein H0H93_009362 [Arthromyces matolae]|nr:hypothetical protein H0H93_009362 [Arthromyces matolae]